MAQILCAIPYHQLHLRCVGNPLTTTGTMAGTLSNLNPFRYKY